MADKLIVEVDLDTGELKKDFKQVGNDAKKAGKNIGSEISSGIKRSLGGVSRTLFKIGGAVAAITGGLTFTKAIAAANEQEDSLKRLNTQLKITNSFSRRATKDFQNFANSIQDTTRFGDESVLSALALAKAFGATNDQAKDIVSAATDLADTFKTDLESATRNVAKTLGGFAGELGEQIPQLKELSQNALRAGAGIKILGDRFKGAARERVQQFSGALAQLQGKFGDTFESIGYIITQNPKFVTAIKSATKFLSNLIRVIDGNREAIIAFINNALSKINTFITQKVIPTLKEFFGFFKDNADIILTTVAISKLTIAAKGLLDQLNKFNIAKLLASFNPLVIATVGFAASIAFLRKELKKKFQDVPAAKKLQELNQSLIIQKRLLKEAREEEEKGGLLNKFFSNAPKIQENIKNLQERIQKLKKQIAGGDLGPEQEESIFGSLLSDFKKFKAALTGQGGEGEDGKGLGGTVGDELAKAKQEAFGFSEAFDSTIKGFNENLKDADTSTDGFKASLRDLGGKSADLFKTGLGNAFTAVGAALQRGQNGFKAFRNGIVAVFGDIASIAGDTFIKLGIAEAFINPAKGAGLIAAGAALKVFGGFISAGVQESNSRNFGGGGGAASAAPADTGQSPLVSDFESATPADVGEVREGGPNVQIVVQGDILDNGDNTAQRILDILNDNFERKGGTLNNVRIA